MQLLIYLTETVKRLMLKQYQTKIYIAQTYYLNIQPIQLSISCKKAFHNCTMKTIIWQNSFDKLTTSSQVLQTLFCFCIFFKLSFLFNNATLVDLDETNWYLLVK